MLALSHEIVPDYYVVATWTKKLKIRDGKNKNGQKSDTSNLKPINLSYKLMEISPEHFQNRKKAAKNLYDSQKEIYCPYFETKIKFNSDGFHHLQFSARRERNKKEQLLKFNLLKLAIGVIKKSGTLQEYRKVLIEVGNKGKSGTPMKWVEYWGFTSIVGESKIKIRAILRRIGDGNIIFWSVMPDSKLKGGQKMYDNGIEDE